MPVEKVEISFDPTPAGNYFVLNDATHGVLDNTTYTLGGAALYDITQYVTNINLSRGKNRQLDRFNSGHFTASIINRNRYFDPTYTASPFYGQIVPRRNLQYSVDGIVQFYGVVDDWNLSYSPDGNSMADVSAYDGLSYLSSQTLPAGTATSQLSGARINAILDNANVNWPYSKRVIDVGQETLQADVVSAGTNVMSYINTIEQTEPGIFFIDAQGNATWHDRTAAHSTVGAPVLADDGTGIKYSSVKVVYGSELLYNQAVLTRLNGATATANDYTSQNTYGIRSLTQDGLLMSTDTALANLAAYTVNLYKDPEFRFESMDFLLHDMSLADRQTLLNLDIGDVCVIKFTPNGISPAIQQTALVIGVGHSGDVEHHVMTLNFQSISTTAFILNDTTYGLLDFSILSY